MKAILISCFLVAIAALFAADQALASEYFVVKSRSGILRIVDHKPGGGATVVKGPFKTREEAEKAVGPTTDTSRGKGRQ